MRAWVLAALLLISAAAVVTGTAMLSPAAAWMTAGVLLAGWAWLVLAEASE
jgi:hypothetical protein